MEYVFFWGAKIFLLTFALRHFRILSSRSIIIYVLGIGIYSLTYPQKISTIPEKIILFSVSSLAIYALAKSISWRIFRRGISKELVKETGAYMRVFSYAFVISSFIVIFPFEKPMAITMVFFFGILKERMEKESLFRGLFKIDYRVVPSLILVAFVLLRQDVLLFQAVSLALIYTAIVFAYIMISERFTYVLNISELKKGMFPSEGIIKKGNSYVCVNALSWSIYSLVRNFLKNMFFQQKEIIAPFKPLSWKQINELKNKSDLKTLKIQQTIDFMPFLACGIVLAFIL